MEGKNGTIQATNQKCFENITINGTWDNAYVLMEWFTTNTNPETNYNALCQLVNMSCPIHLYKIYELTAPNKRQSFEIEKNIRIIGKSKTIKAGFILNRIHEGQVVETENGRRKYPNSYIRSIKDVHIENIKIETKNFKNSVKSNNSEIYYFLTGFYNPNGTKQRANFTLLNCSFNGFIKFEYAINTSKLSKTTKEVNTKNISKVGFDKILISNCIIEETHSLFTVRHLPYDSVIISNNTIHNIYAPVFSTNRKK